jgi:hypothetical protein
MADEVGSFENILNSKNQNSIKDGMKMDKKEETIKADDKGVTVEIVSSLYPDIAAHFRNEGAEGERARIQGIESIAADHPAHGAMISEMKFDGKTSPADAALKILGAEKIRLESMKVERKAEGAALAEILPSDPDSKGDEKNSKDQADPEAVSNMSAGMNAKK